MRMLEGMIIKLLLVLGGIVVAVTALTMCGCVPKNAAAIQKNVTETSDDSITLSGEGVLLVDPLELIQAKADAKVEAIRAQEEKWRLLVWILGAGAVLLSVTALLIRSPLEKRRADEQRRED